MRGKVVDIVYQLQQEGITPAYAGKSIVSFHLQNCLWDHPRLCGEKVPEILQFSSVVGSPPPMRGKAGIAALIAIFVGITPAYAGKSIPES